VKKQHSIPTGAHKKRGEEDLLIEKRASDPGGGFPINQPGHQPLGRSGEKITRKINQANKNIVSTRENTLQ